MFYCMHCARHFIDQQHSSEHLRSKLHKKRVKALLKDTIYTQKDADKAVGLGVDNGILSK